MRFIMRGRASVTTLADDLVAGREGDIAGNRAAE